MIRLTPIVRHLVIINVLIFIILNLSSLRHMPFLGYLDDFFVLRKSNLLGLRGGDPGFMPWQALGWFFAHVDPLHILFNMMGLASLGPAIESVLGSKRFLRFYLFCGIVGGFITAIFDPSNAAVLGASGAIFGITTAFAILFPDDKISFFFLPPLEAKKLVMIAAGISLFLVLLEVARPSQGSLGGISHFGHLSGIIAAYIYFNAEKHIPFLRK